MSCCVEVYLISMAFLLTFLSLSSFLLSYRTISDEITKSAEPGTSGMDSVLREIYVLYSDCALVREKENAYDIK